VDKLAESYYSESPYSYAGNNPILFYDVAGLHYEYNNEGEYWYDTETGEEVEWQQIYDETLDAIENGDGYTYNYQMSEDIKSLLTEEYGGGNYYATVTMGGVLIYNADWMTGNLSDKEGLFLLADYSDFFIEKNNPIVEGVHNAQQDFINHPATKITVSVLDMIVTGGIGSSMKMGLRGSRAIHKYYSLKNVDLNPLRGTQNCHACSEAGLRYLNTGNLSSALNLPPSHPKDLAKHLGMRLTAGNLGRQQTINFITNRGDASAVIVNGFAGNWTHSFNAQVRYGEVVFWNSQNINHTITQKGFKEWMKKEGWTSFNIIY